MEIAPELLALASPEELAAYRQALALQLATQSPLDYAEYVTGATERYRHVVLLNDLIVRLVTGKLRHPVTGRIVRKLAVSMPPRHGKSFLISDHTPAWAITRWAGYGFRVGLASYEADFASEWGRKARQHVQDHPEFGIKVDGTSRASDSWDLLPEQAGMKRAGMNTAGVGGPFTGKGFHLVIIDDPIKNNEWAMSPTIRNKQYDWLGSTALTRLEPTITTAEGDEVGRAVILVNTRWHEDDLMGRVLKDEPDQWYHLNLKGLADQHAPAGDPLHREPGEALCPERVNQIEMEAIRQSPTTGGYWFAAMYQGEPSIEGGGIFKRSSFRYHRPGPGQQATSHYTLPEPSGDDQYVARADLNRFSVIDLAATKKTYSDWTVLATFDITPDRKMLLTDLVRQKLDSADHEEWVLNHFQRLRPSYVGVEASTYGITLITQLQRAGVAVRPLRPQGDKISRAITAGSLLDAGRIFFPTGASWLPDFEHELLQFPNSTHDDMVDTLAYAALEVSIGPWSTPQHVRKFEDRSLEARLARYLEAKTRGRGKRRHPDLGRM